MELSQAPGGFPLRQVLYYILAVRQASSGVEQLTRNEQAVGSNPTLGFSWNVYLAACSRGEAVPVRTATSGFLVLILNIRTPQTNGSNCIYITEPALAHDTFLSGAAKRAVAAYTCPRKSGSISPLCVIFTCCWGCTR